MNAQIRAFLIDLDGVLYQEERVIPGTTDTLLWLSEQNLPYLFVTNTTSRPRAALIEKLARMGIEVAAERILTPAVAAAHWLREHVSGPIGVFMRAETAVDLGDLPIAAEGSPDPVSAVLIGDYGDGWSFARLNRAFRWLMQPAQPPLVALGMTRYWRADDGLRLDTGPFVVALEYATNRQAVVLGKPAVSFFEIALKQLDVAAADACMIGDDILSDVGGALAAGIPGLLVKTGKFQPQDLKLHPKPLGVLPSFAHLPHWWEQRA